MWVKCESDISKQGLCTCGRGADLSRAAAWPVEQGNVIVMEANEAYCKCMVAAYMYVYLD